MRLRPNIFFLSTLMLFIILSTSAQTLTETKEMADLQLKHGKYKEALENYLIVQKERPKKLDIKYSLGVCYLNLNQINNAEQYLLFVAGQKDGNKDSWYHLGRLNHLRSENREAVKHYKRYLKLIDKDHPRRELVKHYILQCATGMKFKYKEQDVIVNNLGEKVNGKGDDYNPMISPSYTNLIYFSSVRRGNIGGKRDIEGNEDDLLGEYHSDIFTTKLVNGEWKATRPFESLLNSPSHDEIIGFTDDATVMVYYKGYDKNTDGAVYTDTLSNQEKAYYPAKFSSPYRVNEGNRTPFIFNDSILIFAANKPEGFGGLDLYVTMRIQDNYWTRPENLGPQVNSAYDEQYPFLCKDGRTLYFSSNGKKSIGGYDIFKSTFNDRARAWSEAKNVGLPFNSPADDISFCMSSDGLKSYFSSNRLGSVGGLDIFTGYFKTTQKNQVKVSQPIAFNLVGKKDEAGDITDNQDATSPSFSTPIKETPVYTEPVVKEDISIGAIYYDDDNVLTSQNKNQLNKIIRILKGKGLAKIEIVGHADESDPEKFRTYFTFLRAEKAGDYLKRNGIDDGQIIVKGAGSNYPVAFNYLERNMPNEVGQKMNRRIEFRILNESNTNFNISYIDPNVDTSIKHPRSTILPNSLNGLSYRVQIAALKGMYDSDLIVKYPDSMIEKEQNRGLLRYSVGLYRSFSEAKRLQDKLVQDGVNNAFIVAYVDGKRITPIEAEELKSKHYDLRNYIRATTGN